LYLADWKDTLPVDESQIRYPLALAGIRQGIAGIRDG
jgi:hypothetical protein